MSDIVDRLRGLRVTRNPSRSVVACDETTIIEAADTIEKLRAALVKIDLLNTPLQGWSMSDLIDQEIVASGIRAALGETKA